MQPSVTVTFMGQDSFPAQVAPYRDSVSHWLEIIRLFSSCALHSRRWKRTYSDGFFRYDIFSSRSSSA